MNAKPLSSCVRVAGYTPKDDAAFLMVSSKVAPSLDVPGLFSGHGVEIDFEGGESGATSIWLTFADAEALLDHLQGVVEDLELVV